MSFLTWDCSVLSLSQSLPTPVPSTLPPAADPKSPSISTVLLLAVPREILRHALKFDHGQDHHRNHHFAHSISQHRAPDCYYLHFLAAGRLHHHQALYGVAVADSSAGIPLNEIHLSRNNPHMGSECGCRTLQDIYNRLYLPCPISLVSLAWTSAVLCIVS